MLRRVLLWLGLGLLILSAVLSIWLAARILFPSTSHPTNADAIVVLAGGSGERADRALALVEDEVADTLVISTGNRMWEGWAELAPLCESEQPFDVICVYPIPDTTQGEAITISELATARGWDSLALVTSTYHLTRATVRFERCFPGVIHPVKADAELDFDLLQHEFLGGVEARLLDRQCGQSRLG